LLKNQWLTVSGKTKNLNLNKKFALPLNTNLIQITRERQVLSFKSLPQKERLYANPFVYA